jgi:hypothetical protein
LPTLFSMLAILSFFAAVLFAQLSAFFAFTVPPRNWQQIAFYRRAYARTAPWRLQISRVGVVVSLAFAGFYGILAVVLAVMNVLVPTGLSSAQVVWLFTPSLLLMGALSLLISARTHQLALRSRRKTAHLMAPEAEVPAASSETAMQ